MILKIKVNPKSKTERIEKISDTELKVSFNTPPEKGLANKKLIDILSKYYKVSKPKVTILKGTTSSNKLVKID